MIDEETIQDTYFSISDASGSQLKSYQNPNVISERSYYFWYQDNNNNIFKDSSSKFANRFATMYDLDTVAYMQS